MDAGITCNYWRVLQLREASQQLIAKHSFGTSNAMIKYSRPSRDSLVPSLFIDV